MRSPTRRVAAACVVAAIALAACGDDDDDDDAVGTTGTPASEVGVLPPTIVDLSTADGSTVEVAVGNVVDLTGGGDDVTAWTAEVADPGVVSFTPGHDDDSATFNPGLTAVAEGSTEVTLTNATTGETVTITVDVG